MVDQHLAQTNGDLLLRRTEDEVEAARAALPEGLRS
jgi:hypothetical protein